MKTMNVVFENNGEFSDTWHPISLAENFTGDLNATHYRLLSHDDFGQTVITKTYSVREVKVPNWASFTWFVNKYVSYRFALALTGEWLVDEFMTEDEMYSFFQLGEKYQYLYAYLRKSKNEFLKAMLEQIRVWLKTLPSQRKYTRPLSEAQFDAAAKYAKLYEAKQITTKLYWNFH